MKILIVNVSDIEGGAARAGYRLHQALLEEGIESEMLVEHKSSDDFTVRALNVTPLQKSVSVFRSFSESIALRFYKNRTETFFSSSYTPFGRMVETINQLNPDVVHLHWISGGVIKVENLKKIKVPIVWSLHDMWAFTGGCHYDEECGAFRKECGSCKVLGSDKEKDLSRKGFNRKEKTYQQVENMTIVGLSRWLHESAKESTLLKEQKHINLPNPIDTRVFKAFYKDKARELWNLPKEKKLILIGAMYATSDPRKGFKELREALAQFHDEGIELVVFGSSKPQESQEFRVKTHYLGSLQDTTSLVTLYSAVDVVVVPSLQENLSNVIMEGLACATPVLAFDIGGNNDMIEHKHNGYLAKPFESVDLKEGLEWILNASNYEELCHNARAKVVKEFDSKVVAKQYIKLYEEVIHG